MTPYPTDPRPQRAIPNAEGTEYPVWFVVAGHRKRVVHAGPFFSRESADFHLHGCRRAYPRGAYVYCASGWMSDDYRHLCETGSLPNV